MPLENILILASVVGALAWGSLWFMRRMARQALNPRFSWQPLDPARGESLRVTVDVEATQVVVVRSVEAHLVATRYAYPPPDTQNGAMWTLDGDRPMGTPEKDVISHSKVFLCHDMMFNPGDPMKLVGDLDVPFDVLPTHTSGRLQIHWALSVRFDIASFPAPLVLERSIEVLRDPPANRKAQYHVPEPRVPAPVPLLAEPPAPWMPSPILAPPPVAPPSAGLEIDPAPRPAATWPPAAPQRPRPAEGGTADAGGSVFRHLEIDADDKR